MSNHQKRKLSNIKLNKKVTQSTTESDTTKSDTTKPDTIESNTRAKPHLFLFTAPNETIN
jgi:hypothetical protein